MQRLLVERWASHTGRRRKKKIIAVHPNGGIVEAEIEKVKSTVSQESAWTAGRTNEGEHSKKKSWSGAVLRVPEEEFAQKGKEKKVLCSERAQGSRAGSPYNEKT